MALAQTTCAKLLHPITLLLCMAMVFPAAASIYRWTDDAGITHFSDRAPARSDFERIRPDIGSARRLRDEAAAKDDNAVSPAASANAGAALPDCATARERLAEYRSAERIIETSVLGDERELSADQRVRLIERQEGVVDRACD